MRASSAIAERAGELMTEPPGPYGFHASDIIRSTAVRRIERGHDKQCAVAAPQYQGGTLGRADWWARLDFRSPKKITLPRFWGR
ncbi:hypothetical protein N7492_008957 [Penicillium capsulatum]|uniref:Uncharacterized protein n=1 Tax=Penicillium capsulatum TaxID=69766 RepID=A0A9W9HWA0_9EURO|nr:hypothetical protein N7492_008957 [Penicillium capsulatum]KAJ6106358.1 hypothetical protein N7512_009875 [Penicillium capsulatum]